MPEAVVEEPEPATPEPTAVEAAVEEPTATPTEIPETPTPVPPTATSTLTVTPTSTPLTAAAFGEAPTTLVTDPSEPIEPVGEVEIASSPLSDPSPFVLLGTLLFALAAAAGQLLRSDPGMLKRLVTGHDGVRRAPGKSPSSSTFTQPIETSRSSIDPSNRWSAGYDTTAGHGHLKQPGDLPTSFGHGQGGTPPAGGPSGLGGHGGGFDSLAKGAPNSFDGLTSGSPGSAGELANMGSGNPGGIESSSPGSHEVRLGHDVAANAGEQGAEMTCDVLADAASRPTDYRPGGPVPAEPAAHSPIGGSLGGGHSAGGAEFARGASSAGTGLAESGLGGSAGGDMLARGAGGTSDVFAKGAGAAGDGFGQLSVSSGDPGTGGSLVGGGDGAPSGESALSNGPAMTGESAAASSLSCTPDTAIYGGTSGESELADRLERLAQALSSGDGAAPGGGEAAATPSIPTAGATDLGPSWLGAGALARAPRQEPLLKTFRCPSCRRPLAYGHRFCGYCGEPLDKTMS